MMEEVGTVIELKGKHIALVMCEKSSTCKNCASMESCKVSEDNRSMVVESHNVIGAEVGDRVRLAISSKKFLSSSFLVYIVPLVALIVGAVVGEVVGTRFAQGVNPDLLAAIFGVAFLVGSFLIIKVGTKAIPKDTYLPRIIAKVPEEDVFTEELKQHGH
ncbi:MAG: SoxR reducing system RseC family protein [Desulfuromonadales bacterium]|nr:SoxR reducing system RseC family protein [Desulfuromonadales bacterium]